MGFHMSYGGVRTYMYYVLGFFVKLQTCYVCTESIHLRRLILSVYRGVGIAYTAVYRDVISRIAQTPLHGFVADLLYSFLYNKSTTNPCMHVPAKSGKPHATKFLVPFFTARCTLVQSAVLRSHAVCLSVRLSVCDVGEL